MAQFDFLVDVENRRLVSSFLSTRQATRPEFVLGDQPELAVRLVRGNSNNPNQPWQYIEPSVSQSIRVAVGNLGGAPTDGSFILDFDGDSTTALEHDATGAEVETALNLLASIISAGGVTVADIGGGGYRVAFVSNGVRNLVTADTDSLSPSSGAFISEAVVGSATTSSVQLIAIETMPAAFVDLTTDLANPTVSISTVREGLLDSTSELKSVVITGEPYNGTYTLLVNGVESSSIPYNATMTEVATAIESIDVAWVGLITATGVSFEYTIEFDKSLGNVGAGTTSVDTLVGSVGKKGTLDLNVTGLLELLGGGSSTSAIFEVQLFDTIGSVHETVLQADCLVKQDLIPANPTSSTPFPDYSLVGHDHDLADLTGVQAALDVLTSDVDDLEARDWVAIPADTHLEATLISAWPSGVKSFQIVTTGTADGYPGDAGVIYTDRRYTDQTANDAYGYRYFHNRPGTDVYFQAADGAGWQAWQKQIVSDPSGVILGDLSYAGQLEATTQAATTDDSLLTRSLGDVRFSARKIAYRSACTGIISADIVTISGGALSVDIGEVTAQFVDNTTDEMVPTLIEVNKAASLAVAPPDILTSTVSFLGLDINGDYVWQGTAFTRADSRDIAIIAVVVHTDFTTIDRVSFRPISCIGTTDMARDLMDVLQPRNESGNVFSANGATLNLAKTVGGLMATDVNYQTNRKDPHVAVVAAAAPVEDMLIVYSDGTNVAATGINEIDVDPDWYEDTATPGISNQLAVASNKWTNQLLVIFQDGRTNIQVGQFLYGSQAAAIAAIPNHSYVVAPVIDSLAVKRQWLTVKGTETDLTSVDTAFTEV